MTLPVQVATAYAPSLVTSDTTAPSTVIRQLIAPFPAFCAVMLGMKPWDASNSVRQGSCTGDLGSTRPGRALLKATRVDLQKKDWLKDKDNIRALATGTGTPTWVVRATSAPLFDPDMTVKFGVIDSMQRFWGVNGLINYLPYMKASRLVDTELLKIAMDSYR